ncbi:MAG TPA: methyltransferase type 12 [Burkholderiales bacterium]|nr:methyltransferase type 12 [Burkholderiales bacterium]
MSQYSDALQVFTLLATAFVAIPLLRRTYRRRIAVDAGLGSRREELWIFFRQWLSRPLSTAAFSPSSRFLNRRMVRAIPPETRRVIELGAGTGALTRTLLQQGIAVDDLLAIEFNPSLHRYLSQRFPGLAVVRGDARGMDHMAEVVSFARKAPVQAVVSGLGLLSMSREAQHSILASAFALMPEDGAFVQFTYGPVTPVAGEVMRRLGLRARRHGFALCNLPPASVFVLTRDRESGAVRVPAVFPPTRFG